MPATAYFTSRRSELIVIEKAAIPIYEGGQHVGVKPGKYHYFQDHRCKVEGQQSLDFMRERAAAVSGPEMWEVTA